MSRRVGHRRATWPRHRCWQGIYGTCTLRTEARAGRQLRVAALATDIQSGRAVHADACIGGGFALADRAFHLAILEDRTQVLAGR